MVSSGEIGETLKSAEFLHFKILSSLFNKLRDKMSMSIFLVWCKRSVLHLGTCLTPLIPLSLVFVLRQWLHPSSLTNGSESLEPESHIRHPPQWTRNHGPENAINKVWGSQSSLDEFPKYLPGTISKFCWRCGLIFIFTYIYSDTATREYENITAKPLW